jgi:tetrahydromethanopterin S-methyltransferase subunit D
MFGSVEAGDIFEVVWVSLAAGIFVTITYSLVVVGGARSAEARRNGAGTASVVWAALAVLAFAAFAAAVVFGVHVMLAKR